MENIRFDPQLTPQSVPQIDPVPAPQVDVPPQYAVPREAFTASTRERLLALLSYPAAFLYACAALTVGKPLIILFAVFSLVFCLGVEWTHRDVCAGWERWVWLAALAMCALPPIWGGGKVWGGSYLLFLHGFAIYYALCRADRLMEGRTSHLLPLDGLWGAVVYPFANFFLRIRVLGTFRRQREKVGVAAVLWSVMAVLMASTLFAAVFALLTEADAGFARLTEFIYRLDELELGPFLSRLALSLPVGAYVYGLVVGPGREPEQKIRGRVGRICNVLEQFREVPDRVWIVLLAVFALLYAVFFFVQGSYLFGAFTRTLPPDFTVAEYARQGFFELCKVMVLNFGLLWLALRSSKISSREHRVLRIAATVILAESLLLAITAASKLWLYIDCFGFTPLRLQSAWLIAVLSAGMISSIWSLWTGRRSVRAWAIFGGLSLALLNLI